jgi:hypothetical protein
MCPGDRSDGGRPPACPEDRRERSRPPACPEKHGQPGLATTSAPARRDVGARREFGQESVPQRDTAGNGHCCAPPRLTIRSRAAGGGSECYQATLGWQNATTWPPAELKSREPLAREHRWRPPAPHTVFCWGKGHLPSISPQARDLHLARRPCRFAHGRVPTRPLTALLCRSGEKSGPRQRAGLRDGYFSLPGAKALFTPYSSRWMTRSS